MGPHSAGSRTTQRAPAASRIDLDKEAGSGTRVGFIGLKIMGGPMAANLVRAGFEVAGYDPSAPRWTDWQIRAAGQWQASRIPPVMPTSWSRYSPIQLAVGGQRCARMEGARYDRPAVPARVHVRPASLRTSDRQDVVGASSAGFLVAWVWIRRPWPVRLPRSATPTSRSAAARATASALRWPPSSCRSSSPGSYPASRPCLP